MNIACGKCFFFESFDDVFATISYGLCGILKMAVCKDDVEDCLYGRVRRKKRREERGTMKRIRDWIKKLFGLHDIDELTVGGHCWCCGTWVPDRIFEKARPWGLCQKCRNLNEEV